MGMILHISEVAGLMFLAFVLGSALGYGARLLIRRSKPAAEVIPAARLAVVKGQAVAPVVAVPVVGVPVATTAPVAVPSAAAVAVPAAAPPRPKAEPPGAVAVAAAPSPSAPTRSAPTPNTALPQTPPSPALAPAAAPAPAASVDDDIMTPARAAVPRAAGPSEPADDFAVLHRRSARPVLAPAEPASHPGIAWDGDLNGHAARRPVRVAATAPPVVSKAAPAPASEPAVAVQSAANVPEVAAAPIPSQDTAPSPSLEAERPRATGSAAAAAPVAEAKAAPVTPPAVDETAAPAPAPAMGEKSAAAPAKVLFGEILPPSGQGAPAPRAEATTTEAAIAREEILAAAASEPPPAGPGARPPLFADFAVPEFQPAPEPAGMDDRNWPEPAPPHPHLQPGATIAEPVVAPVSSEPPTEVAPEPVATGGDSEDDAMRAIEGGWSGRRRGRADRPELIDVSSAVAAAQSAVQQVLAQTGGGAREDADKPQGLPRPRNGARDDLRLISGLSALDESTLNNLGIYHFDQVATWSDAEVRWLEDHVFAQGRIGREDWQQQARRLNIQRPAPPPRFARS